MAFPVRVTGRLQVLGFEVLAKKDRTWTLHYCADATAETDVPGTLLELLQKVGCWAVAWAAAPCVDVHNCVSPIV